MVKETNTNTDLTARAQFEYELTQAFSTPSDDTIDAIASSLHFNHAVAESDKAFESGGWFSFLSKTKEQEGEISFTNAAGAQDTIEYKRITNGNDTLLMATDGERMFITTDDSQSKADWVENVVGGMSYTVGQWWDKLTGQDRQGAESEKIHSGYWNTLTDGGSNSLEARSMDQMSEWLEEHPNLKVEVTGFSRGGRSEFLADNIVSVINNHNGQKNEHNAQLTRVTTLNAPEIGKGKWRDQMDDLYAGHGTEVIHLEGISDVVSSIKTGGEKTGSEYMLIGNLLVPEPNGDMREVLRDTNKSIGKSGLIYQHTKIDDAILNNLDTLTILTPEQTSTLVTKLEEQKPQNSEQFAAISDELLAPTPTRIADIEIDIKLSTSIGYDEVGINSASPAEPQMLPQTPNAEAARIPS